MQCLSSYFHLNANIQIRRYLQKLKNGSDFSLFPVLCNYLNLFKFFFSSFFFRGGPSFQTWGNTKISFLRSEMLWSLKRRLSIVFYTRYHPIYTPRSRKDIKTSLWNTKPHCLKKMIKSKILSVIRIFWFHQFRELFNSRAIFISLYLLSMTKSKLYNTCNSAESNWYLQTRNKRKIGEYSFRFRLLRSKDWERREWILNAFRQ